MTDGTSGGYQTSPITEDEMSKVHDILRRAADSIVGMSQLKADVDALQAKVQQLTSDLDRLQRTNGSLEESLYQARQQRQALEATVADAKQQAATAQRESSDWQARANYAEDELGRTKDTLKAAQHDRDEAEYRNIELSDKLKIATDKIASIHSALGLAMQPPEVVPVSPTSGEVVQPAASPSPEPAPDYTALADPTPTPISPVPPLDMSRPYHWDDSLKAYVND